MTEERRICGSRRCWRTPCARSSRPRTSRAGWRRPSPAIAQQAAAELTSWAEELSEGELQALRDPRNWVRPVAAVAAGGAAAGALVIVGMRRRRKHDGLRDSAEKLIRDLRTQYLP